MHKFRWGTGPEHEYTDEQWEHLKQEALKHGYTADYEGVHRLFTYLIAESKGLIFQG